MDGAHLLDLAVNPRPTPLGPPLIVDSFAGGGGASTGIEMALGRGPDIAINHNPAALALHAANHPDTLHLSENVYRVDPLDHLAGRHIGLMWFSPDCRHFSKAKGGAPVARNIRDLAWVIPGWIERIQKSGGQVDVVIMENVEEWKTWGPVIETPRGPMPCPQRRGETFERWRKAIRRLGGKMETRELRACDYGAPTIRKRLFVIIRFDGQPIVWPAPTHGAPEDPRVIAGDLQPWRTAAECIDWSIPCPSIFDSAEEIRATLGLRAARPLADNTLARIARGVARYVLEAEAPFLFHLRTSDTNQYLSANPTSCYVRSANGSGHGKYYLAKCELLRFKHQVPHTLGAETHTTRNGTDKQDANRVRFPIEPFAPPPFSSSLTIQLTTYALGQKKSPDGKSAVLIVNASPHNQNVVRPTTLIQTGYGERPGQAPRALDHGKPLGTIVAGGAKHATCAAFLDQQNGGPRMGAHTGHDARDPLSTVAASGSHQTPVATFFAKYYGTGDGARTDAPCHTITVKDRMAHLQAALQAPPFTEAHEARASEVAEFLRAHGAWEGGDLVALDIAGTRYVIADIGMRMLTPRELFTAQGFPRDYVIEGVWEQNGDGSWDWRSFTKNTQVSCVGNSVCPPVAAAVVKANCGQLAEKEEMA